MNVCEIPRDTIIMNAEVVKKVLKKNLFKKYVSVDIRQMYNKIKIKTFVKFTQIVNSTNTEAY